MNYLADQDQQCAFGDYPQARPEHLVVTGGLTADERAALDYSAGYLESRATKHEDALNLFWGMFTNAQQTSQDRDIAYLRTAARKLRELLAS